MEVFNTNQRMKTAQAIIESIDKGEHGDVEVVLEDGIIKASKLILSSMTIISPKTSSESSMKI